MQQISKLAEQAKQSLVDSSTRKPTDAKPKKQRRLRGDWIAGIFEKLRLRYGAQWEAKIGVTQRDIDEAMDTWSEVLHDLTAEELIDGFLRLDEKTPKHPPSVMEFKSLCRDAAAESRALHRTYDPRKMLPTPKADFETGMKGISAMRKSLGQSRRASES